MVHAYAYKGSISNARPLLLMEEAAMEEFEGMDTKNPNAVVIGLAPSKFRYDLVGGGGMKKQ